VWGSARVLEDKKLRHLSLYRQTIMLLKGILSVIFTSKKTKKNSRSSWFLCRSYRVFLYLSQFRRNGGNGKPPSRRSHRVPQ
jgi:hypothetical protein